MQHHGHEKFLREETPKSSSDRSFGVFFSALFCAIALWPLMDGGGVRLWALGIASVLLLLGLFRPGTLAPLNRLWTRFGLLLHRIVSPIMLGAIYVLAFVPTAQVMRIFGYDSMHRSFEPDAKSYWVARDPDDSGPPSMKRQF